MSETAATRASLPGDPTSAAPRGVWDRWIAALAGGLQDWRDRNAGNRVLLLHDRSTLEVYARRRRGDRLISKFDLGTSAAPPGTAPPSAAPPGAAPPSAASKGSHRTRPAVLRLARDQVLQQTLTLPPGTSDIIDPIVENQLSRIMPWPEQDIRHGHRLIDKGTDRSGPRVGVAATSREVVDKAIADARAHGYEPVRIECAVDDDPPVALRIANPRQVLKDRRMVGRWLGLMAGLAAVIALAGGWRVYETTTSLENIREQTAQLNARAAQISAAARKVNQGGAAFAQLAESRGRTPSATIVLEALSRVIPDHSWVTRLDVTGQKLQIYGQSSDPTALIAILEASPHFSRVAFSAPITRSPRNSRRTFALTAQIDPRTQLARRVQP